MSSRFAAEFAAIPADCVCPSSRGRTRLDAARVDSLLAAGTLVAAYVFGTLLDPLSELEAVQLALLVGEPPEEVPWMSRPARLEALASLCRFDKLPVAQRVWTAAEFERLSPAEQDAIFAAAIVRDLADVPPAFLARVRARFDDHIGGTEPRAQ